MTILVNRLPFFGIITLLTVLVLNREVMVCEDMFTSEDTGLQIADVTAMNLTVEDMRNVSQACYHERISMNLEALGYNPDTFCPMFETVLPLQFQVLGEVITSVSDLDSSSSSLSFPKQVLTSIHSISVEPYQLLLFPR